MQLSEDDQMTFESGLAAFEAKHFARAMQLLSPLAEAGHADAQYRVAIMCQNGLGVVRQPDPAVTWMRAAAEQGHAMAQHGLGFMFFEGDCVDKDPAQAVHWFEKAAEQGLAGSKTTLAMMYAQGTGVERDPEAARRWYLSAGFDPDELDSLRS
ncbi:tetratricopeptide repeat protein [Thioalkalivibrio nitratireducens]|nr:tetratricopeptide repeat protein [Thioalkalivibrio nitratireducens]